GPVQIAPPRTRILPGHRLCGALDRAGAHPESTHLRPLSPGAERLIHAYVSWPQSARPVGLVCTPECLPDRAVPTMTTTVRWPSRSRRVKHGSLFVAEPLTPG